MEPQYIIEMAKNAASNGRALNLKMFVLVLFIAHSVNPDALWLAYFPPASLGAAFLADRTLKPAFSWASITLALVPFLSIFYL